VYGDLLRGAGAARLDELLSEARNRATCPA
jgi:hypothetical protein